MICFFRNDGGRSAARAATSTIWGATTGELNGVTGRYFGSDTKEHKNHPVAADPAAQARVIEAIEAEAPTLEGVKFPGA